LSDVLINEAFSVFLVKEGGLYFFVADPYKPDKHWGHWGSLLQLEVEIGGGAGGEAVEVGVGCEEPAARDEGDGVVDAAVGEEWGVALGAVGGEVGVLGVVFDVVGGGKGHAAPEDAARVEVDEVEEGGVWEVGVLQGARAVDEIDLGAKMRSCIGNVSEPVEVSGS